MVVVLLVTNIVMLAFFLNMGPEKRGSRNGKAGMLTEFLKKEIGFSPQQLLQYDTLSNLRHEKMKSSFNDMRNSKEQQLKELGAGAFSDSAISIAADKSAAIQKEMELNMLHYFATIRKLCTPDQLPKFDSLFYKVWNKRGEGRNKTGK